MAIKFEKLQPGMVLWDVHRQKVGNTTLTELGAWKVQIVSVDPETRTAMVVWNGNPERKWYERELKKLYVKLPKSYLDQQERKAKRRMSWGA